MPALLPEAPPLGAGHKQFRALPARAPPLPAPAWGQLAGEKALGHPCELLSFSRVRRPTFQLPRLPKLSRCSVPPMPPRAALCPRAHCGPAGAAGKGASSVSGSEGPVQLPAPVRRGPTDAGPTNTGPTDVGPTDQRGTETLRDPLVPRRPTPCGGHGAGRAVPPGGQRGCQGNHGDAGGDTVTFQETVGGRPGAATCMTPREEGSCARSSPRCWWDLAGGPRTSSVLAAQDSSRDPLPP